MRKRLWAAPSGAACGGRCVLRGVVDQQLARTQSGVLTGGDEQQCPVNAPAVVPCLIAGLQPLLCCCALPQLVLGGGGLG